MSAAHDASVLWVQIKTVQSVGFEFCLHVKQFHLCYSYSSVISMIFYILPTLPYGIKNITWHKYVTDGLCVAFKAHLLCDILKLIETYEK